MGPRSAFLTWLLGAVLLLVLASTQATTTPGRLGNPTPVLPSILGHRAMVNHCKEDCGL